MSSASQPNITTFAMSGMPSGRGRKKNQVPRKRAKTSSTSPDTVISTPHSLLTPSIQPLASTISSSSTTIAPPGMHEASSGYQGTVMYLFTHSTAFSCVSTVSNRGTISQYISVFNYCSIQHSATTTTTISHHISVFYYCSIRHHHHHHHHHHLCSLDSLTIIPHLCLSSLWGQAAVFLSSLSLSAHEIYFTSNSSLGTFECAEVCYIQQME